MAGHSKWANIQHRKNAQDAKRGRLFTKLIRELTVAARMSGGDPQSNPRLRAAVDGALDANMPKGTIDRAIKRGSGVEGDQHLEEVRYEGYGPGGVAILVGCLTDNRNRTVSEVRHIFTKVGGSLGTDGSVAYLFSKVGQLIFQSGSNEEKIMEVALETGAKDVTTQSDGTIEVTTAPDIYEKVRKQMLASKLEPIHSSITMQPANWVTLDVETATKLIKLVDALEDLDDIQEVFHNADIPEGAYS